MKILSKFFKGFKKSFNEKGFTLIELLVVIGILGILAAGLLATIDPLEQFRKGADSNRKTTALELTNAITRYYAVHGVFPWDTVANGGSNCDTALQTPNTAERVSQVNADSVTFLPCLQKLEDEGELKPTFKKQYGILNALYITDNSTGTAKSSVVCFNPDSKSESLRPETNHTQIGGIDATCPTAAGACYWCAQ